ASAAVKPLLRVPRGALLRSASRVALAGQLIRRRIRITRARGRWDGRSRPEEVIEEVDRVGQVDAARVVGVDARDARRRCAVREEPGEREDRIADVERSVGVRVASHEALAEIAQSRYRPADRADEASAGVEAEEVEVVSSRLEIEDRPESHRARPERIDRLELSAAADDDRLDGDRRFGEELDRRVLRLDALAIVGQDPKARRASFGKGALDAGAPGADLAFDARGRKAHVACDGGQPGTRALERPVSVDIFVEDAHVHTPRRQMTEKALNGRIEAREEVELPAERCLG